MNENMIDTMVLGGCHSIMVSNIPNNTVKPELISEKFFEAIGANKDSIDKFGLFGSGLNYHTFYPDVDPSQFVPSDDEFIEPMYRLLSNCIVSKSYMPTEFPKDVLKKSMGLLVGQTVNCDHNTDVGNAIGTIKSVVWQESYTDNGITIPAGINGVLKIDAKSNPRIARGINMDPPSIHSNSVTVQFEWKPSHQFEKIWEFYDKLGTIAEDGTMVRRIATNIISYKETSLVSHGADPFAQIIKDGKIINPQYANSVYGSFSDNQIDPNKLMSKFSYIDFKGFKEIDPKYNTSKFNNINHLSQQNKNNKTMNELQVFIEQLFGEGLLSLSEGSTPSKELVLSEVRSIILENSNLKTQKDQLTKDLNEFKGKVTSLTEEVNSMKPMHSVGVSHLKEVRDNAIALYKKTVGEDNIDNNIISLLESESTNLDTLVSLSKTYEAQLEDKFPLHCADCGSQNVNRSSSIDSNKDDNNKGESLSIVDSISKIASEKLK